MERFNPPRRLSGIKLHFGHLAKMIRSFEKKAFPSELKAIKILQRKTCMSLLGRTFRLTKQTDSDKLFDINY